MSGPPPNPNSQRARRGRQVTPWKAAPGVGWQHGRRPRAPYGLTKQAQETWATWFAAWWASFWAPEDVPQLELAVRLWEAAVVRGELAAAPKFEAVASALGLTPKGRQNLRWAPPAEDDGAPAEGDAPTDGDGGPVSRRRGLRVVDAAS